MKSLGIPFHGIGLSWIMGDDEEEKKGMKGKRRKEKESGTGRGDPEEDDDDDEVGPVELLALLQPPTQYYYQ